MLVEASMEVDFLPCKLLEIISTEVTLHGSKLISMEVSLLPWKLVEDSMEVNLLPWK